MMTLKEYILESLSNEITNLRNKLNKLNKEKIFDGNYNLDDSLDPKFHEILVSLNPSNVSNSTLIRTWRMLFSKLIVEPLVGEIIGDKDCEYSTIKTDREEKWDIKYKNKILIDVKATFNDNTKNFGLSKKDADFIANYNNSDLNKRYIMFICPEIRNWNDAKQLYKDKSKIQLRLISYSDFKEILNTETFEEKGDNILISFDYIEKSDKFRKNIKE